jgi:hypothetical protein
LGSYAGRWGSYAWTHISEYRVHPGLITSRYKEKICIGFTGCLKEDATGFLFNYSGPDEVSDTKPNYHENWCPYAHFHTETFLMDNCELIYLFMEFQP